MDDDEIEIGECGYCHEQKEIVAEMEVSANKRSTGELAGKSGPINLCEECIPKVVAEVNSIRSGPMTVTAVVDEDPS